MKSYTCMAVMFLSIAITLSADAPTAPGYPQWWLDVALVASQPPGDVESPEFAEWRASNYAPLNVGQLMNAATLAAGYLDEKLDDVGGAGDAITEMIEDFDYDPSNYSPANVGQLKAVTKKFYDRLLAVGFDTNQFLKSQGYASNWQHSYPWNPAIPVPPDNSNYSPANLGQLKLVFAFDLTGFVPASAELDSDEDGLRDAWEMARYGNLTTATASNWTTLDANTNSVADYREVSGGASLTVSITTPANGSSH